MAKLTKEDFTEFEDGDYTAANHPHWICIRGTRPGDYYARVSISRLPKLFNDRLKRTRDDFDYWSILMEDGTAHEFKFEFVG